MLFARPNHEADQDPLNDSNPSRLVKPKDGRSRAIGIVLLGAIAFLIGAIVTWAILSWQRTTMDNSERQRTTVNSSASADIPPDVSTLTPSQGAVTLGNWYFDHHDWAKATEQYRKAIDLGLDNADVRSDLGSALRFANQPAAAAAEYEAAQRENPEHENSLFNLATLYLQSLNEPNRAIALLEEFKTKFPRSGAIPRVEELLQEARKKATPAPNPSAG
jgi:tetratricopeptide (TPR) repeat protein